MGKLKDNKAISISFFPLRQTETREMFPHVITTNWSHVRFGLLDLNDMSVYLESRRTTWTLFMHCPKYLHNDSVLQKKNVFSPSAKLKLFLQGLFLYFYKL